MPPSPNRVPLERQTWDVQQLHALFAQDLQELRVQMSLELHQVAADIQKLITDTMQVPIPIESNSRPNIANQGSQRKPEADHHQISSPPASSQHDETGDIAKHAPSLNSLGSEPHLSHQVETSLLRPCLVDQLKLLSWRPKKITTEEDTADISIEKEISHLASHFERTTSGAMSGTHLETNNVIEFLQSRSRSASWALFLGGFGRMRIAGAQRVYDFIFVSSFIMCWASCLANMFAKTPPYYHWTVEFATVYFHICGLHLWVFWRDFVGEGHLSIILKSSVLRKDEQLWLTSNRVARVVLVVQIIVIVLGFIAFPQPAIEYYLSDKEGSQLASFSVLHAVLMWLAIPQHVATVVSSLVLYSFVCKLHMVDMDNLGAVLWDQNLPLFKERLDRTIEGLSEHSKKKVLEITCVAVEAIQERLSHTCRRVVFAWCHQTVYAIIVLCMVHSHMIASAFQWENGEESAVTRRELIFNLVYNIWHGLIGLLMFITALVIPAMVTGHFMHTPRRVFMGLRMRGFDIHQMDTILQYLQGECVGYRVGYAQISQATIGQITSVITILSSVYAALYA